MYVADQDTYGDVFCQACGEIADRETLNDVGLCEDCASPLANIIETAEATQKWLETIISPQPRGRAEYTKIGTADMPDRIYDTLIDRLDELKADSIAGYRKYPNFLAVVLHKRRLNQ